ncbi:MAG: CRISPR-associated endonuclease Cas2 [Armatimonadetes bacterium CG_4_10_14_3_um_filter_66_18]|nr:MAG: CRISPR-associated endonuclease Cas2 [Armatimonadetes bacterium CG06_land_8_20_14_3_00_66_21]PIX39040.1 MAG: CRISPR-associated endonuclease Cas2 [Armatimonadetes bacterium CG_4_8_14_3_um_filter_66_20]PIY35375.1 MAG: CRISPR-associated endonuclease Cas2 [Armatimonadetes bacterium CG_4_10_14_3_um_filter_66_18]PIZ42929.1 MAG: CRISPR-associated endonuclease Cas2 [Armatimonadetes bacterium CG_4_10_14_0_8_um_filter_66_14]PJB70126.1 MAG: CRISPR-associated endonuclease Cas2 [Armatimonadetes bacte
MWWIVACDIVEDDQRAAVAGILDGEGERVQYSVFECDWADKRRQEVAAKLRERIDSETDSVRFYPLCETCRGKAELIGVGMKVGELAEKTKRDGWVV